MVVLIDEDRHVAPSRRFRQAPPIATDVRGKKEGGTRSRMDDYDTLSFDDGYTARTASRMEGQVHAPGAARHVAIDALRQPSSPRSMSNMYEQRAMRSNGSSIRDYRLGNGSSETFDI